MSSGDFGNQGFKFGWPGAMDSGMVDRDGDATIEDYTRATNAERRAARLGAAKEVERIRVDEEVRAKAEADRQILELRQRLRSKGPLLARALGLDSESGQT
jgi:hypothetical protein